MKLTAFHKALMTAVLPYLGVIIVVVVLIFWLKGDIKDKTNKISLLKANFLTLSNSISSLSALRSEYELAKPHFSLLENILPSRDEVISFAKDTESYARKEQMGFGFSFGNETKSTVSEPGTIDFRMGIQASYPSLISFLKDIEKSRYLVNFTNFEATKKGFDYDVTINGQVFSR
ncbi:MAG: type 4a pilus biogenesis protein PilO [Candidatus Pacebacteria bacterium]|nr:type 4a pilus biogenesis protein PilO [Candidatus Paceibacterota bacterium]